MWRRILGMGLVAATLGLLAYPAWSQKLSTAACPTTGGTLRYGLVRDPIGFDPHIDYGASSSSMQGNLYDGLVQYNPNAEIAPDLAVSWTQPSASTYVFTLRRGVTFHDGSPFTAADVVATFQRIMNPATGATWQSTFADLIASVRAVNDTTVEVRLKQPNATFLLMLASPEAYVISEKWATAGGDFKHAENGTGPFRLVSFEPNARYVLQRYPGAWHPACLDGVVEQPILDDRARVDALRSGQVDFIEYVPWQDFQTFSKSSDYHLYQGFDAYNIVRLNPNRPPLNNPKVRQALNFLISRKTIALTAFGGLAEPMTGFLFRRDQWVYNPQVDTVWRDDPQHALALLREAGVSPQDLHLDFTSTSLSVHLDSAQAIVTMLKAVGVTVTLHLIDVPELLQERLNGNYMMLMDGLNLAWPDPDVYYGYYHSGGIAYAAGVNFKDPALDQLLEEGRRTVDQAKRKVIYNDAERLLYQDAPWVYLVFRPQGEATRSYVKSYFHLQRQLGSYSTKYFGQVYIQK